MRRMCQYNFSMNNFSLQPASDFPLADLADLLTRSFEG